MTMLADFAAVAGDRHGAARSWKSETGNKVFGYFTGVSPEEILFAADVLPIRITGTGEPLEIADQHLAANSCPFARSALDAGLRGHYDYLDGVVVPNTCDVIFYMHDLWSELVPRPNKPSYIMGEDLNPYVFYINYPEKVTGRAVVKYYTEVLKIFKQKLERSLKREITDDDLRRAITAYGGHHEQMRRMYELRRQDPPALSGHDAWQIAFSSLFMPKDRHTELLTGYLDEIEANGKTPTEGVRIYLSGSAMDAVNSHIIRVIEESGGVVVSDDLCVGTRSFWGGLDPDLPPLEAIARRSLSLATPSVTEDTDIPELRWGHIADTTEGFDIQGAVFLIMKCCDARTSEFPHLRDKLREERDIPTLFLEGDYSVEGIEQMRPRVEAFIEMIEG
jgi:benzoyl-CoA reductase subunit C